MKNTSIFLRLRYAILFLFLLPSVAGYSHWSSKGPYGGSLTCFTVADTVVYAGTADGGIYRSVNQSFLAWKYVNYTGLTSSHITALTSLGRKIIAGTDGGVFVSSNAGVVWAAQNTGLTNTQVLSLLTKGADIFAGTSGGGVFISSDSGSTWTAVNTNLGNLTVTSLATDGYGLFAGTSGGGIFMSTNNGGNWFAVNTSLSNMNIHALAISGSTLFAATSSGVFTSPTLSVMWSPSNNGLGGTQVNGLTAIGSSFVLAATNSGAYSTPTMSVSWSAANTGLPADTLHAIGLYANTAFAGTKNNGIWKSTTSSLSWSAMNNGFNNLHTYALYNSNQLIIGATNKGLYVSRDLAASYVRANSGLTDSLHVSCVAFGAQYLYAGTASGGVFISTDTGTTWTTSGLTAMGIRQITTVGSYVIATTGSGDVYCALETTLNWGLGTGLPSGLLFTSVATDGSHAFLGTIGNGVYTSTTGQNWTTFNTNLSNMNVTSLAILNGYVFAGTDGNGVFRSAVGTANWSNMSSGLPTMQISSLCAAGQHVVAGYKGGVYYTYDNAVTWLAPNIELYIPEYADVYAISFSTLSTRVFIATPCNSFYSNALTELPTGIEEQQADDRRIQIVPNPNNGRFTLRVDVPNAEVKQVTVYDVTGALIEQLDPKQQEVSVDYPSGIYFMHITTSQGILVKKMVIE